MTTLLYPDEALTFVPVHGSLSTAPPPKGSKASGFDHAPTPSAAAFPAGPRSLASVLDPSCNCLRNSYIELDVQVPHLTTWVSHLSLFDSAGAVVLDVAVVQEQQTRFVMDGAALINRVRLPLNQTSATGDFSNVASVSLHRAGREDLANIDPVDRPFVFWVLSSLRLRYGCKGQWRVTVVLLGVAPTQCGAKQAPCLTSCVLRVCTFQSAVPCRASCGKRTPSYR